MGLLKAPAATAPEPEPAAPPSTEALLAALAAPEAGMRRSAARALASHPAAIPAMAAALSAETQRPVQQALIGAMAQCATPEAVAALVGLLRAPDAWLRNAALEALQAIGPAALAAVESQLADPDPCTRISAVVTLSGLPAPGVEAALIAALPGESDLNVLAALVEALDQVGGAASVPALERLINGQVADPFLAFAASMVHARLAASPPMDPAA